MPVLTREQILQAQDLPTEAVEVPEWGGSIYVRGLSGTERDAFEASVIAPRLDKNGSSGSMDMRNIRAKLAALCIVDENGERLFTDKDVEALGRKSASALDRVFSAAQRLSGLSPKDVEELAKNSGRGQNGGSISA
jgi:hypothetical protein